jgi:hypothetical protein
VLGLLAWLTRLQVLRPVPNLGGSTAIATEARRLHSLAALGLRVPEVLAQQPEGLLLRHLGRPGEATLSFDGEMQAASAAGPQATLALWQEGLAALQAVHARGACLSQAFARNLVRCPDGVGLYRLRRRPPGQPAAGAVPGARRTVLCAFHGTVSARGRGMPEARAIWAHWLAEQPAALGALLATTAQRLAWLRHLPQDRRWGRDPQRPRRLRSAEPLLHAARHHERFRRRTTAPLGARLQARATTGCHGAQHSGTGRARAFGWQPATLACARPGGRAAGAVAAPRGHRTHAGGARVRRLSAELWEPYRTRRWRNAEQLYTAIGIPREERVARLQQMQKNAAFLAPLWASSSAWTGAWAHRNGPTWASTCRP